MFSPFPDNFAQLQRQSCSELTLLTDDLANRLATAIGTANQAHVADKASVALRTITRILAGEPARRTTLVRLARSLAVSEDWLIDGNGPMRHLAVGSITPEGHTVSMGAAMPFEKPEAGAPNSRKDERLFPTLNMERAARALRTADDMFAHRGARPTDRERVQAMALIYDLLIAGEAGELDDESRETRLADLTIEQE